MINRKVFFDAVSASPFAGHMIEGQVSGIEQANVVDVTGDWNGTTTTQSTVVTQAVLLALN